MIKSEQIAWWKTFSKFQKSREATWRPKINAALRNQINPIIEYLKANGLQATISYVNSTILPIGELSKIIKNIYIDAGTVFGGKAYQMVKKQKAKEVKQMMPIGYNEELVNEIIQYFQLNLLNEAVLPITSTTRDQILRVLTQAQQEGVSINEIVKQLSSTDLTYNRSRLIARTETVKAANIGAVKSVNKLGYDTLKIWISAHDLRTRRLNRDTADHFHMDGVTIPMNDDFRVPDKFTGYDLMAQPGDPRGGANQVVNCRCVVGFSIIG